MKLSQVKNVVLVIVVSMIFSNLFAQVQPKPPIIKFVSVNPSNNDITIAWYKSPELLVDTLFISHIIKGSPSIPIYFTKVNDDNSYTVNVLKVASIGTSKVSAALSFAIDAKKSGFSSANLKYNHSTIYAKATFQTCPTRCVISWTKYQGTKPDDSKITVNKYTIYKSELDGNIVVGTVSGNDSTCAHQFTQGSGQFDYFVEAEIVDAKGVIQKSTSNMASATVTLPKYPSYLNADYVKTKTDDNIELSFLVDVNSDIKHFQVYKSEQLQGTYTSLASGNVAVAVRSGLILNDTIQSVALKQHFYKICAINSCGDIVQSSNILSNIVTTAEKLNSSNSIAC